MKKNRGLLVLLLAVAAFAIQPAAAQDTKHKVYIYLAEVIPTGDGSIDGEKIVATDEVGYGIGYEFRLNKLMGLDFDYMTASHDVEHSGWSIGQIDFQPWSLSLNFHFINTKLVDFYAAPTISYVNWSNFGTDGGSSYAVDNDFAYGVSTGIDIGNERFAFVGGLRYLVGGASLAHFPGDVMVDPLLLRYGFAFKF